MEAASRGTGRPSKGDRRYLATRVPTQMAEAFLAVGKSQGLNTSDALADAVTLYLTVWTKEN